MNLKTQDILEKQLFALTALIGIDECLNILQRERVRVVAAINGDRAALRSMTVADFVAAIGVTAPPAPTAPKRRRRRAKKVEAAHVDVKKVVTAAKKGDRLSNGESKMQGALKAVLASGPQPIRKIAIYLKRHGVTKDTSPDTKRTIVEFLSADKTFSIKTRGVYGLRSRGAAVAQA